MATTTVSITIVYESGDDGWTIASIPEVPGVHSQGQTRAEARDNVLDALSVMLAPDDDAPAGDREAVVLTIAA